MNYIINKRTASAIILGMLLCTVPMLGHAAAVENRNGIPNAESILNELEPERRITPRPSQP